MGKGSPAYLQAFCRCAVARPGFRHGQRWDLGGGDPGIGQVGSPQFEGQNLGRGRPVCFQSQKRFSTKSHWCRPDGKSRRLTLARLRAFREADSVPPVRPCGVFSQHTRILPRHEQFFPMGPSWFSSSRISHAYSSGVEGLADGLFPPGAILQCLTPPATFSRSLTRPNSLNFPLMSILPRGGLMSSSSIAGLAPSSNSD